MRAVSRDKTLKNGFVLKNEGLGVTGIGASVRIVSS